MKKIFIQEAQDFFTRAQIDVEYRDNSVGVGSMFCSKETEMLIYYSSKLDLSINIDFEKDITIKMEHLNTFTTNLPYDMNVFKHKLDMVLEYINTHKSLRKLRKEMQSDKISLKRKTKNVLEQLNKV